MYTGRIQDIGTVHHIDDTGITVASTLLGSLAPGASFSVNGVCLSVAPGPDATLADSLPANSDSDNSLADNTVRADVSPETRARTTLDEIVLGARVNVELPLAVGDPLDGHLVQGHVDAVGKVVRVDDEAAGARRVWIRPPKRVLDVVVPKGSITVDGVSLTIAEIVRDRFSVALIPTTLAETTLSGLVEGDRVNLETDVLAKLLEVDAERRGRAAPNPVQQAVSGLPWAGQLSGSTGVEKAAAQLAAGGGVVVWDPDIEGEGDVVFAGALLSGDAMTFLLTEVWGHTTVPCSAEILERLAIPPMAGDGDRHGTAFHNSLDLATNGTGVSAHERAATIRHLANPVAQPSDFCQPGHVFPLRGRRGGLAERRGHTEASLDLCRRAGLPEVAAICEVMAPNGHMRTGADLATWSLRWGLPMISIEQLLAH